MAARQPSNLGGQTVWAMILFGLGLAAALGGCQSDPIRGFGSSDDAALERSLNKSARLVQYRSHDGWSLLHSACSSGNVNAVRLLLSNYADPSVRDYAGRSALQFAAMSNNEEIINLLIDHGADVNAHDVLGFTALHYSVLCGDEARAAHALLSRGAAPNAALPDDGRTPLHTAAELGYLGTLKELIDFRANVNVQDADGRTPLYLAVGSGLTEVVRALLRSGACTELRDSNFGQTPLELAREEDKMAIIALLEKGGDK